MPGSFNALAPLADTATATLGDALVGYRALGSGGSPLTGAGPSSVHGKLRGLTLDAVEDFGADPTGVVDATTRLQALFDACFGPVSAPNGPNSPGLNRIPFIPPGTYKLSAALNLKYLVGATIMGGVRSPS